MKKKLIILGIVLGILTLTACTGRNEVETSHCASFWGGCNNSPLERL